MTSDDSQRNLHLAVEAVWRIESGRLIAGLARVTGDVGLAEELAQDALVAALEQWPRTGIPPNPAGWLMVTAKNRAVDAHRRRATQQRKLEQLAREAESTQRLAEADVDDVLDDHIGDDVLRLMFTACHPALSLESRVALTLRCLGGLATHEIARAFLVSEPTVAQRIVRAKRTLTEQHVAFELPDPAQMAERLAAVLEVVYLVFNEGYSATAGEDWMRPELCDEALRLGRILAARAPGEPEVHGLLALMELQASRLGARIGADGAPVLMSDQDRRRWDRLLIRRGLASLGHAQSLSRPIGPYTLRPRSRPVTRAQPRPPTPTGRRSRRCTACSPSCGRHPWSSSTARSPSGWRPDPARGWRSSMRYARAVRCGATRSCPRCAVSCSRDSAAARRPAPSSRRLRR